MSCQHGNRNCQAKVFCGFLGNVMGVWAAALGFYTAFRWCKTTQCLHTHIPAHRNNNNNSPAKKGKSFSIFFSTPRKSIVSLLFLFWTRISIYKAAEVRRGVFVCVYKVQEFSLSFVPLGSAVVNVAQIARGLNGSHHSHRRLRPGCWPLFDKESRINFYFLSFFLLMVFLFFTELFCNRSFVKERLNIHQRHKRTWTHLQPVGLIIRTGRVQINLLAELENDFLIISIEPPTCKTWFLYIYIYTIFWLDVACPAAPAAGRTSLGPIGSDIYYCVSRSHVL